MADALKVGDIVQLNSGGPKMTIQRIVDAQKAWCTWFDGHKRYQEIFELATLVKAE